MASAEIERAIRRYQLAGGVMLALAVFYAFLVWRQRHAVPGQVDGSVLPYIGLFATAPAALLVLGAATSLRVAPHRRLTTLLRAVAAYAGPIGLFVGAGLLLPSIL